MRNNWTSTRITCSDIRPMILKRPAFVRSFIHSVSLWLITFASEISMVSAHFQHEKNKDGLCTLYWKWFISNEMKAMARDRKLCVCACIRMARTQCSTYRKKLALTSWIQHGNLRFEGICKYRLGRNIVEMCLFACVLTEKWAAFVFLLMAHFSLDAEASGKMQTIQSEYKQVGSSTSRSFLWFWMDEMPNTIGQVWYLQRFALATHIIEMIQ